MRSYKLLSNGSFSPLFEPLSPLEEWRSLPPIKNYSVNLSMFNTTPYHPQYFTATILEWKNLLKLEKYKKLIIETLAFLVKENRVTVYAFVIMDNHIHLIWQMKDKHTREKVQGSLLRYTANIIKKDLTINHPKALPFFKVDAKDRTYQIWERNALSIDLYTPAVFRQKLEYIHQNLVRAKLVVYAEDYYYSSARYYFEGKTDFEFLEHYSG